MLTTGGIPFDALPAAIPAEPATSAEEGPESPSGPAQLQIYRACKFLQEVLTHGPLPSTWVTEAGKHARLPERTLKRARSKLKIRVLHSGGFGKGTRRFMALPDDPAVPAFMQRKWRGQGQQDVGREAAVQRIKEAMQRFEAQRAGKQGVAAG